MIQRGDTIMFNYTPTHGTTTLCARAVVTRVIRESNVACVRVWSGASVSCLEPTYYEDIEVSLDSCTRVGRKK